MSPGATTEELVGTVVGRKGAGGPENFGGETSW